VLSYKEGKNTVTHTPLLFSQKLVKSSYPTIYLNLAGDDKAALSSAQFYKSSKSLDPL